jgi:hypothetical protein
MDNKDPTPVTQNMSLFQEVIFVATICTAQLYARKLSAFSASKMFS